MKYLFCFLTLLLLSSNSYGQKFETIKVNVQKEEITIDNFTVKRKTSIDDVIKALGKPDRIEKSGGQDRVYIYDTKGVVFSVQPNGKKQIEAVAITYSYDGDLKVAKEKYQGALLVDNTTVTEKTSTAEISEKTEFGEIACAGNLCATNPENKGLILLVGLKEEKDIMQIAFGFKP